MSMYSLLACAGIAMAALSLLLLLLRLIFGKRKNALQCLKPFVLGLIIIVVAFWLEPPSETQNTISEPVSQIPPKDEKLPAKEVHKNNEVSIKVSAV